MDQKLTFRYFYGNEADQYSFYRIPKLLFKNEYFKNLSSDAKILYGLMLDRMSLSIKNQWFDEQNRAYIYFSIEDIMELLNCGRNKAVKSLQELDDENGIGLIEKRRQGFGKANIIYVKSFMVYEEQAEQSAEEAQKFTKQTNVDTLEDAEVYKTNSMKSQKQTSRSPENKLQEVCNSNSNYNNTSDIKESMVFRKTFASKSVHSSRKMLLYIPWVLIVLVQLESLYEHQGSLQIHLLMLLSACVHWFHTEQSRHQRYFQEIQQPCQVLSG